MTNTRPRIVFNSSQECNACENAKSKKLINWSQRKDEFIKIIKKIKSISKK